MGIEDQSRRAIGQRFEQDETEEDKNPLSSLEQSYTARTQEELRLYGRSFLKLNKSKQFSSLLEPLDNSLKPSGAVQESFIIGPGDKIRVTFRGQRDDSETYQITAAGQLIVDGLDPVPAAGRSMGDLIQSITAEVEQRLLNSVAYVSLEEVRQVGIMIVGEIEKPGQYQLSAFHTVIDALIKAGGLKEHGSFRNIVLSRQGERRTLDLYDLIFSAENGSGDILLKNGDRIIVPTVGHTVAIAGDVKKPAIYEIGEGHSAVPVQTALKWAGQTVNPMANRYLLYRINPDGQESVEEIKASDLDQTILKPSDVLQIAALKPGRTGGITLSGHNRQNGFHALAIKPDLQALLPSPAILDNDIYPLFGVIERASPDTLAKRYIPFSPIQVVKKRTNLALSDRDHVQLFSSRNMARWLEEWNDAAENRSKYRSDEARDLRSFDRAGLPSVESSFKQQQRIENNSGNDDKILQSLEELNLIDQDTLSERPLYESQPALWRVVTQYLVHVRGAVQKPGAYPVVGTYDPWQLVQIAGGASEEADTKNLEVMYGNIESRPAERITIAKDETVGKEFYVSAKDTLRLAPKQAVIDRVAVAIRGEVKRPGLYDLKKGDTLLDLYERAGGLTDLAYAEGVVFTRESERRRKQAYFNQAAQSLEESIATQMLASTDDERGEKRELQFARQMAQKLRSTPVVGRIVVEANPEILESSPKKDVLLQPGDKIFVPRRTRTVNVAGEVHASAALAYSDNKDGRDYIEQAGGHTRFADMAQTFVVYPDGSSYPLRVASWNHQPSSIPPGSTIIVPRDPKPFQFIDIAEGIGNILSQLAITSVAIAEIKDD